MDTSRRYRGVFNASPRRPDITVEVAKGELRTFTLVEVKNPADDSDDYRRKSLYKCFGYLYDFADVLDPPTEPDVCFLVFPGAVRAAVSEAGAVSVVSGDEGHAFSDRLAARIKRSVNALK
jgi:hypothetical protein